MLKIGQTCFWIRILLLKVVCFDFEPWQPKDVQVIIASNSSPQLLQTDSRPSSGAFCRCNKSSCMNEINWNEKKYWTIYEVLKTLHHWYLGRHHLLAVHLFVVCGSSPFGYPRIGDAKSQPDHLCWWVTPNFDIFPTSLGLRCIWKYIFVYEYYNIYIYILYLAFGWNNMLFLVVLAWDADSKLLCLEGLKLLTRHIDRESKQKRLVKLRQSGKKLLDELTSEHHLFKWVVCLVWTFTIPLAGFCWMFIVFIICLVRWLLKIIQSLKAVFYNNL